jgi:uncharacterized membrane-anchored protein
MRELVYLTAIVMVAIVLVVFVLALLAHRRDQHIQDVAIDAWRSITSRFRR